MHKYQGKYYLSYPGLPGGNWPEAMYYAVADKPLGPYVSKGQYIPHFAGQAGTNHGSILPYKGKWLALHHAMIVSEGHSEVRNLMADWLEYNPDGSIKPITPTKEGVSFGLPPGPSKVTVQLEPETAPMACGELQDVVVSDMKPGFTGSGYVTGLDEASDRATVMVQSSKARKARLKIRYSAPSDQEYKVMVNHFMLKERSNPDQFSRFPKSEEWSVKDLGLVNLKEGDNYIHVIHHQSSKDLKLDCLYLEQVDE